MALVSRPSKAWMGLVGFVIITDGILIKIGERTMSSAFRESVHHPRRRWPVSISWALLTLHLFTSTKYDPISIAGRLLAENTPGEVSET